MKANRITYQCIEGMGPRKTMEDFGTSDASADGQFFWFIVSDGIGGKPGGAIAAEVTVSTLNDYFKKHLSKVSQLETEGFYKDGVAIVVDRLSERIREDAVLAEMGCTVCMAIFYGNRVFVSWSGDSRFYLFRNGACLWDSHPHNWSFDLCRKGVLTLEEARLSETSYLTGSIHSFSQPIRLEHKMLTLQPDDRFVLCTDGVWALFEHPDFIQLLIGNELSKTVSTLERHLLQYSNDNYLGFIAEFQ